MNTGSTGVAMYMDPSEQDKKLIREEIKNKKEVNNPY